MQALWVTVLASVVVQRTKEETVEKYCAAFRQHMRRGSLSGSKCAGGDAESESDWDSGAESEADESPVRGALGPIASTVLMQVLYTARMCRYDLLRATGRLATLVTKCTQKNATRSCIG